MTDGIINAGKYFGCKDALHPVSIDDIEAIAHELGHWIALGHVRRPPRLERLVTTCDGRFFRNELQTFEPDLGVSIDTEVAQMTRKRRNANEMEAAAVSLGTLEAMRLQLPRGIYGKVFESLDSPELYLTGTRAARTEIKRLQSTQRIQRMIRKLLRIVEKFS
jgi:hypothetical protein